MFLSFQISTAEKGTQTLAGKGIPSVIKVPQSLVPSGEIGIGWFWDCSTFFVIVEHRAVEVVS